MTIAAPLADVELDPKAIGRWARELPIPDAAEIVRRADVPGRVDSGLSLASAAVHGAIQQLPSQRERRRRRSFALAGMIVIALAVAGGAALWRRRAWDAEEELEAEREFDRDAFDRAADDGARAAGDPDRAPAEGPGPAELDV